MMYSIERDTLQTVGGTLLLFTILIGFTDATLWSFAPLLGLFVGMLVYEVTDDLYDLPEGASRVIYGLGIGFAGVFFIFSYDVRLGGLVAAVGTWFMIDGVTKVRYGQLTPTHEFASGAEDEAMLRMQVMNTVYRTLQDSDTPRTTLELAESCDLTRSRVSSALEYMEHRNQVIHTAEGYCTKSQKWGKATPLLGFLRWVPRRLVRPLNRMRYRT